MNDLLTPKIVVDNLIDLGRQLDTYVTSLQEVEMNATTFRHQADIAESEVYLSSVGPVEFRKHSARIACKEIEEKALVAEATLRWLKIKIHSLDSRIEIGRSLAASVRSEFKYLPYEP